MVRFLLQVRRGSFEEVIVRGVKFVVNGELQNNQNKTKGVGMREFD